MKETTLVARPPQPWVRAAARALAATVTGVVGLVAALLAVVWEGTPTVDNAAALVTQRLAAHGARPLSGPVPARMAQVILASEDRRFFATPGIDPVSLLNAPVTVLAGGDLDGATLEQRLAGTLFVHGDGLWSHVEESVLALKLDRTWSKTQILRMCVDDGYYGHGFYGLTAASEGYFGVPPGRLSWMQASLLGAVLEEPRAVDDLFIHPAAARARQGRVLARLVTLGDLTRARARSIERRSWRPRAAA